MDPRDEAMFLDQISSPTTFRFLETAFGWERACTWLAKYSKSGWVAPHNPTKAQAWLIKAWNQVGVPAKARFYPNIEMWRNIKWQKVHRP